MKHVLVIRLSALGDVAIMAPLVQHYAAANPGVHFTIAAPPLLEPLFEGVTNVSFLGVKKKQNFFNIYHVLEKVGADTVIDLHKVNRVGYALTLMRLRHLLDFRFRIYSLHKGRFSRWLFLHHWSRRPRRSQYDRYEDVFRRAGLYVKEETGMRKHPESDSLASCSQPSNFNLAIGIAPFAQHAGKIWPFENTCRLVELLAAAGYSIFLFGSREEAPQLEKLAARHQCVTSLAGRHTFKEELAIIRNLTLMVSMDSANMHFASAVGTPVVSIWGATHPDFGFYGHGQPRDNALCADLPCQPCSAYGKRPCRYGNYRCLSAISPNMVFDRVVSVVSLQQNSLTGNNMI